jgi:asparagine synthase (glutamine-hydrolysing)
MCGICGVFGVSGILNPAVRDAVYPMTARLRHRGPDGDGHFVDARAALGHRRLAIIDRAGGAQPMVNDAGSWIVFNGEIYNHRAIRADLTARGFRFQTSSDTEVILQAYQAYGPSCVDRLQGMFAFAIYTSQGELFLARDRLGKKPLFYAVLGGALHFASEIEALRCSPRWDDEVDPETIEDYLSLGYIPAPRTIYTRVRKLPAGHWLLARNGDIQVRKYWEIEAFDDHQGSPEALEQEISLLLRQAVKDRLESEVPLGAFLSGGIDSGLVVSYMAEALDAPVHTTTVGFGAGAHNELNAAALTANRWQTRQSSHTVEPRLEEVLDPVVRGFGEPFADASAIPTYYVSAIARREVTVALTGDGGDELFAGYSARYAPHAAESAARHLLPGSNGRRAAGLLARVWPRSRRMPRALRWGTLLDNLAVESAAAYFADLCVIKPGLVQRLMGRPDSDPRASSVFDIVTAPYRHCPSPSAVQRAEYADLKIYLADDVMVKADRMSMAHGLELRSPLLDHRLVELAFRIPVSRKMPRLQAKHLLKRVARSRLPEELLRLPKRGFDAPMGAWIADPYREAFADDVLTRSAQSSSWIDQSLVRSLFDAHVRREADHGQTLWTVWMLERWCRLRQRDRVEAEPEAALARPVR